MTTTEWQGIPPGVAAERAAVLAEVDGSTLLTEYEQTVAAHAGVAAHSEQDSDGNWRTLSYGQVRERVRDAALGLAAIGLQPGEFAVIWSANHSDATVADYAVMHARGVPVSLYNTLQPEQAAYIAGHCEATIAIVENQEYYQRLASVRDQLPRLRRLVVMEDVAPPGAMTWAELLAMGQAWAARDPGAFDAMWRQVAPGDLATLIYTSGTTGQPKGVMITQHHLRCYQAATGRIMPVGRLSPDGVQRLVSYLPMAHVTGRSADNWGPMAAPTTVYYCPDQLRVFEACAHARPTRFTGIPRVWEKLYAATRAGLAGLGLPDATAATVAPLPDEVKQAILARPGLDACLLATSGSAPLDTEIIAFFHALGLPITEAWGMTELSNAATIAPPDRARLGTVGTIVPGMEARIADDGEVLIRGPLVMDGYYKDRERTAEALDAEGWMHTGDIGEFDDEGYLKITDRKKDLIITSGGKNISPVLVEHHLQRHPLIGQACAIGDRRNYVTALLVLDPEAARAWAAEHGLAQDDPAALASHPDVLAEVARGVTEANSHLARVEQVRRWRLLPVQWTSQAGELTPTMKKRRRVIAEHYAADIDALYA